MFPVLIISHGELAEQMIKSAELMMGPIEEVYAINFAKGQDRETLAHTINQFVHQHVHNEGVLIFIDMFGGSCLNSCTSLYTRDDIDIICGVNLPMLLSALTYRLSLQRTSVVQKLSDEHNNFIVNVKERLKKANHSANK